MLNCTVGNQVRRVMSGESCVMKHFVSTKSKSLFNHVWKLCMFFLPVCHVYLSTWPLRRLPGDCSRKVSARQFAQVYHEGRRLGQLLQRETVNEQFARPYSLGIGLTPAITGLIETEYTIQEKQISELKRNRNWEFLASPRKNPTSCLLPSQASAAQLPWACI